jgi:Flp pilus assembly protein TadG
MLNGPAPSERPVRPRGGKRPAAAVVEFAVIAPIMILVLVGAVEVARAIQVKVALSDAVRDGCRLAAEPRSDNSAVQKRVSGVLSESGIDPAEATVAVKINNVAGDVKTAKEGDRISVSVMIPLKTIGWVGPMIFPADAKQTETLSMMRQR